MVVEDVLGGTALPISAQEQEQRGKAWQRAPSSGHWEPTGSPAGCRELLGSPARVVRRWVRRHEAAGPCCVCSSWFPSRRGQGRAPQIVQLAASCRACCNKKRGWAVVQEREQRKPQPRRGWQHPRGIASTGRGWAFPRGEPSGAGSASPAASGCNQCLQSWLGSFPASSQVRCFPQEAEPVAPCAGVLHVRCSRLWPQQLPRRGVRAPRTPSRCPRVQQQRAAGLWGLQNLGCEKQSK